MNVLFLTISALPHMSKHSISLDLLREFKRNGHNVYAVGGLEKKSNMETYVSVEDDITVLRVKIGNNKKANIIQKGITTLMLPKLYIRAIKQYFGDVKFDLVLYPTPPVTHVDTVSFIKKRDGAKSYLMLKDIFPQNAADIGMMRKTGLKGLLYKHFRRQEKRLYAISDRIGCMSQANVDYVLRHNPEIDPAKVEICPNSIEIEEMSVTAEERSAIREKYGIPTDKKVFVYGGNLGKPQGIPFVMDCMKKLAGHPEAFFLIVGDGTEFGKLQAFMDETKPDNILLLKRLPKEDYDRMVCACDVGLIFLDHRFTIPNFPSRLLSYMQAGLPVLAATDPNTDVGKVIVEGGFGWWCESNDADAFSALVDEAVCAPCGEMSEKGKEYLRGHYQTGLVYRVIVDGLAGQSAL